MSTRAPALGQGWTFAPGWGKDAFESPPPRKVAVAPDIKAFAKEWLPPFATKSLRFVRKSVFYKTNLAPYAPMKSNMDNWLYLVRKCQVKPIVSKFLMPGFDFKSVDERVVDALHKAIPSNTEGCLLDENLNDLRVRSTWLRSYLVWWAI